MELMEGRHRDLTGISANIHHGRHSLGLLHGMLSHTYEPGTLFTHEDMRGLDAVSCRTSALTELHLTPGH